MAAAAFVLPSLGSAQDFDDVLAVDVLTGWREADGTHIAALRLDLAPGWKTYWRVPGDGGIPPEFDFSASEGVAGVATHWPVPDVFDQNGLRSVGYEDSVVIPLRVRPDGSGTLRIAGEMDLGLCEEICIPVSVNFSAQLPPQGAADSDIQAALSDRMLTAGEASVGSVTCSARAIEDGLRVTARVEMPQHGSNEVVVVEAGDRQIWASEPEMVRTGNVMEITTDLVPPSLAPFALDRSALRFTILSAGPAVDIQGCTGG